MLRPALTALLALGLFASTASALEIGDAAPAFSATGIDGKTYTLDGLKESDVIVLCFTCNACPVAKLYEARFNTFAKDYAGKKVTFVGINCNNKTEDLAKMKAYAEEAGIAFPYAYDETAQSATAYGAQVTPHLFVINKERKLAYKGAFDDKMRGPETHYVADAVDALLAGKTPPKTTSRPIGCGIKAKRTN